jgi:hypothetical protein
MEYWSVGVLRKWGIAPRVRGVGCHGKGTSRIELDPGLKPWAESYRPFGAETVSFRTLPLFGARIR